MKIKQVVGRSSRVSQIAYTLVEVVVCVALIVICFVSLYGGMSTGFAVTQASRENLRATQIMLEYMEGIRLYNWDQLTVSNWIPVSFARDYYPLANSNESKGITYYGSVFVTNADSGTWAMSPSAAYSDKMRAVIVTINWTNGGGPHNRRMSTYVARNGMQNYVFASTNN
jgi:hypothetical protein